ncbi:hypothetical protein H4R35_002333 [Dimargaris xerosporica]|nr:hypothetical protein H4R35_002333 [Dimargaris xerosporica]
MLQLASSWVKRPLHCFVFTQGSRPIYSSALPHIVRATGNHQALWGQRFKATKSGSGRTQDSRRTGPNNSVSEKSQTLDRKRNNVRRVVTTPGDYTPDLDKPLERIQRGQPDRTHLGARTKDPHLPKCMAVTTAERYDLTILLPRLQTRFTITPVTNDVYHLTSPSVAPDVDHDQQPNPDTNTLSTRRELFSDDTNQLESLSLMNRPTQPTEASSHAAAKSGSEQSLETAYYCDQDVPPTTLEHSTTIKPTPSATNQSLFPDPWQPIIPAHGEVFLFQSGAFVAWGLSTHDVQRFLWEIIESTTGAEIDKYDEVEVEDAPFKLSVDQASSAQTGIANDTIVIGPRPDPLLAKLAFSHGVARSAKLAVLEGLLDRYLNSTANIPRILQRGHKIPWSRSQVLQQLGQLLSFRSMLNLHSESFLDTPEYYWSKPQLEAYYDAISRNLDIGTRTRILNTKLDYANELAGVLREQLSETHSLNLEWCIIILITVEVIFELAHYWEKYNDKQLAAHHTTIEGPLAPMEKTA